MSRVQYLFCLFLFIFLYACEEEEDVPQPKSDPKLTLNSLIGVDSLIRVHLSESTGNAIDAKNIDNASITIAKNDKETTQLNYLKDGIYELSDSYLEENASYKISVVHSDYDNLQSKTKVPKKIVIDQITQFNNSNDEKTTFQLSFKDNITMDNYYMLLIKGKSNGTLTIIPYYSDDLVFEGNLTVNETDFEQNMLRGSRTFSDENFNDTQIEISFYLLNDEINSEISEFEIELYHITEDYYNYERSYVSIENRDDLPFYNKTNLYSNIEGAFGIFTSYAVDYSILPRQ